MSGYLGMTADVVPADAAELVEADLRQRLEALRAAVSAHHPGADPAAVTAKMFDVLMGNDVSVRRDFLVKNSALVDTSTLDV